MLGFAYAVRLSADIFGPANAESVKDNYAGNEGTISTQATTLGWSAEVWDLSGDAPKLK